MLGTGLRVGGFASLALSVALLVAAPAAAAPARPADVELAQPDGSIFTARQWGDEHANGYEVDGRTVVQRPDGTWYYATSGPDGALVATDLPADGPTPWHLPRHLRPAAVGPSGWHTPQRENLGEQPILVLLAEFTDRSGSIMAPAWATTFFAGSDSVADYYDEVSYGQLDLVPVAESHFIGNDGVVGWLNLGYPHPDPGSDFGPANQLIVADALTAADPFVDYAAYDSNDDGAISADELHLVVVVAGSEHAYGNPCTQSVWAHRGSLESDQQPTLDGVLLGDFSEGGGYAQFGELHCEMGDEEDSHQATIGIIVHELGHDLALPDLYDYDGSSEGAGDWSVMAGGTWLDTGGHPGSVPSHPDAWSKTYEGWVIPYEVTAPETLGVTQGATAADVIQLLSNAGGIDYLHQDHSGIGEYFLVENRQLAGYDAGLPGCGLLIWHIDETRPDFGPNRDEDRKLTDVEEADGRNDLDDPGPRGDDGDPWPGSTDNRGFTDTSTPDSKLYDGSSSGVAVTDIQGGCAETMTADFTGTALPDLTVDLLDDPDPVSEGALLTYAIEVENIGGADATDAVAELVLSEGLTFESASEDCIHDGSPAGGTVACDLGTLEPEDSISVEVSAVVDHDEGGGVTRSDVTVSTDEFELDLSNNSDFAITEVLPEPAPNDDFVDAADVTLEPYADVTDTTWAGVQPGEDLVHFGCVSIPMGKTVWYRFTPSRSGEVFADTNGSAFDSVLVAYEGTTLTGLTEVACDDDGGDGVNAEVSFEARAGKTYYFQVGGFNGANGIAVFNHSGDPMPFSDIRYHWAREDILAIYDAGWTNGYPDGTYRPENTVNRAEIAKFVILAMGETPTVPTDDPFPDVPKEHWAAGYIERLVQLGITGGYNDGTFQPDRGVNRAEMAKFIILALGETPTMPTDDPFPDVPKEHWAAGYIERLVQLGIIGGYGDGTYRPDRVVTRAEIAKVLNQAFLG